MEVARIQALYEYNTWANGRVLEAASRLTPEQFLRNLRSSYPSIRDTLAHVIGGEWIWLMRWKGSSPKALPPPSDFPTLPALNTRWLAVQLEQSEFVSRVTEDSLALPVAYSNTQGNPFSYRLWQTMQHVVNHSTYHRGQVTTMLRQLDASRSRPTSWSSTMWEQRRKNESPRITTWHRKSDNRLVMPRMRSAARPLGESRSIMRETICFLHEIHSHDAVGGKARGLTKLIAAGFPVPDGFVAMPDATDGEIVAAYRRLGAGPVAVRSSAEEEDSQTRSYAGQFDTFLDVSGEAQVVEAVKACRASASSPRVASYREDDAGPPPRIAVIVQQMVRPDYAGVALVEPNGPTLIEAVPGLADRLVSGRASPAPLPDDVRGRVERVAREAVERLGAAQDLEWAAEGDRIWLLQARPVTALLPAPLPDRFGLWTAANVQEAIPRPLTPLSEELTLANISQVFGASYAFGGLPPPAGPHVRFVNGRVYMSYSAMASAMSAMPGFRIETLLLMFGDSPQLAPLISYRPEARRYFFLRLPATLVRSVAWFLFAERYIERAWEAADRFEQRVRSTLAGDPTDAQLLELLRSVLTWDSTLFEAMSVSTSMANRLLGTLMSTGAEPEGTSRVDAAALAVTGDIESLEPVRRLAALAEWLRANPSRPDDDPEVEARLTAFMEVCGFRCEEEAELANPRWVEQPHEVLRLARQLASAPPGWPGAAARPTRAAPLLLRRRLRVLAAQARIWQRRRERTRAILSRVGMSVRVLVLAIGRHLYDRQLLNAPDEIFYLLPGEIASLLDASALETPRAELIAVRIERRRAHHRRLLASPPPPRLLAELADGRLVPFAPEPEGDALLGYGASPGRATGRARVVRDFGEARTLEPGEILVTRTTDIGWTPLFRLASAVVTEIGAPTSHAAIVARELGLPAVVNVDRVTERIRTGDVLFVDGWAGLVRHLDNHSSTGRSEAVENPTPEFHTGRPTLPS